VGARGGYEPAWCDVASKCSVRVWDIRYPKMALQGQKRGRVQLSVAKNLQNSNQ
jgi:hypothetical protein